MGVSYREPIGQLTNSPFGQHIGLINATYRFLTHRERMLHRHTLVPTYVVNVFGSWQMLCTRLGMPISSVVYAHHARVSLTIADDDGFAFGKVKSNGHDRSQSKKSKKGRPPEKAKD
jgi:hypothetical protein